MESPGCGSGTTGHGVLRNWDEVYAYCNDLVLAEFDDWRLPEVDELQGLKEKNHPIPWINDIFDCYSYLYWSGTTSPDSSISAWAISFTAGGGVDGKHNRYYVRCTMDNSVSVPRIVQIPAQTRVVADGLEPLNRYSSEH